MELSFDGRQELRKATEKLLESVPEGKRIQLPKKTLEMLLFEKCDEEYDDGRLPVWSGEFLKKLDLSQVFFKHVLFDKNVVSEKLGVYDKFITYKDTNAVIDLDEIGYVVGCDFSGTKVIGKIKDVSDSNFSNCQLTAENFKNDSHICNCNFMDNNLHGLCLEVSDIIDFYDYFYDVEPSCYRDTGASISGEEFKKIFELILEKAEEDDYGYEAEYEEVVELRNRVMSSLEGCYVDGVLIKPQEEIQKTASEKKEEYEKMKQDIFVSIENAVTEQNGKPRK